MKRITISVIAAALCVCQLSAQQPWDACRFNERKLKDLVGTLTPFPTWINESNCFYYNVYDSDGEPEYLFVDARRKTKEPMFDKKKLVAQLNSLENTDYSAGKYRLRNITFAGNDTRHLYFTEKKQWYCYDRQTQKLQKAASPVKQKHQEIKTRDYAL